MNAMKEKSNIKILLLLACLSMAFACTNSKKLSPNDFMQWCKNTDNTMVAKKEVGGLLYSLQYLPCSFLTLRDNPDISAKDFAEKVKRNDGIEFFALNISISEAGEGDIFNFYTGNTTMKANERQDYFTNYVYKDLICVYDKDTVPCSMHMPDIIKGFTKNIKIVVAFEKPSRFKDGQRVFIFNDKAFGNGLVKMEIDSKIINNIPKVKI